MPSYLRIWLSIKTLVIAAHLQAMDQHSSLQPFHIHCTIGFAQHTALKNNKSTQTFEVTIDHTRSQRPILIKNGSKNYPAYVIHEKRIDFILHHPGFLENYEYLFDSDTIHYSEIFQSGSLNQSYTSKGTCQHIKPTLPYGK